MKRLYKLSRKCNFKQRHVVWNLQIWKFHISHLGFKNFWNKCSLKSTKFEVNQPAELWRSSWWTVAWASARFSPRSFFFLFSSLFTFGFVVRRMQKTKKTYNATVTISFTFYALFQGVRLNTHSTEPHKILIFYSYGWWFGQTCGSTKPLCSIEHQSWFGRTREFSRTPWHCGNTKKKNSFLKNFLNHYCGLTLLQVENGWNWKEVDLVHLTSQIGFEPGWGDLMNISVIPMHGGYK